MSAPVPPPGSPLPAPTVWTDVNLHPDARGMLAAQATIIALPEGTLDRLDEADAVIAGSRFPGHAAIFARAPRLQAVVRVGIGCDNIDLADATASGICIANTPDAPTESTAEFAIALLLALVRRLPPAAGQLAAGRWTQGTDLIGGDLAGKTLGLVGCGRIGRRVAEIALAFRLEVIAFDPFAAELPPGIRRAAALPELLSAADFVSLHVPLSPATRHLLGAREFALMKLGALLINTARGGLIDESALLAALTTGRLGGAGLDVWDPEPPPPAHPLLRLPNVVATPHMAAFTHEGKRRSHVAAAGQVLQILRGERPAALLNPGAFPPRRARAKVS